MDWATELVRWLALAFGLVVCVVITWAGIERQRQRRSRFEEERR